MMCIIPFLLFGAPPTPELQPHIKGILPEVFEKASFDKKRETYKSKIKALELEKKILDVNLQEAKATRNESKINATLTQIINQESLIAQERNKEKQEITQMEQNAINKINKILGY